MGWFRKRRFIRSATRGKSNFSDYYAIRSSSRHATIAGRWCWRRTQTQVENFPAAIDTYAAAIQIRPDRVDLRTARAELLERLMRFDEAAADYQRLFELNYHDTRWMENVAAITGAAGESLQKRWPRFKSR